ncbi:MAG TPA: MBL fold metallo-hydrolase [Gammaproteobacteria bacterium]|nr:MBL fold metallo-hydrolase [Gammaproteobacteria bacterium]
MTLRFCSLASGSRGNALLVESADTLLLIDCGVTYRTLEERMLAVERSPRDITAVLVTHEHSDHVAGLGPLLRRIERPLWATHGTAKSFAKSLGEARAHDYREVRYGAAFSIGGIDVCPFPVPHDAREPAHYRFAANGTTLGVLTDTGHVSSHVAETLCGVDALAVEFNHDLDSLNCGPYPAQLKARVGSNLGHLNNHQAAGLVEGLDHDRLRWVVALHMSEQNNSALHVDTSMAAVRERARFDFWMATQGTPTGWFEIS